MSPPAATAAGRPRHAPTDRRAAPRTPRRVSGPVRAPVPRPAGPGFGGRPVAVPRPTRRAAPALERLLDFVRALPDHRLLDRLVRGRAWIAVLAAALIGIVFLQVSLLKLNTGIGRAVEHSALLQRENAVLRDRVSSLSSGERLQGIAGRLGLQVPTPGTVRFVSPGPTSAALAVARMRPPRSTAATSTSTTGSASTRSTTTGSTTTGSTTTGSTTTGSTTTGSTTTGAASTGATSTGTATAPSATAAAPAATHP